MSERIKIDEVEYLPFGKEEANLWLCRVNCNGSQSAQFSAQIK
ncbi:Uncharacterised protein [Yersinia pekkanenii]|uniref:Uncharacterized protein n=1 Tax=Yersinia pekkanenii TaxID=1288385 RepID=A0A0T9RFW7_9GAMM|nr:Uncharacterised protein [Yersinia pekkanenii]CRY69571.1 Uncharacterised protein [Yersinia pekkanenii]